jgi:hypothetical protein
VHKHRKQGAEAYASAIEFFQIVPQPWAGCDVPPFK